MTKPLIETKHPTAGPAMRVLRNAAVKAGRAKVETERKGGSSEPKHGRNSTLISDEKLVAIITTHAREASKHSKLAGEGSISALRRYYEIGAKLLEQKELGKFKKPNISIKDFCNRHLIGVIGDKNPYKMVGHSMTLAKPGKNGKPGLWETLLNHAHAMAAAGTPIGPTGINAGLTLARKLIRGDVDDGDRQKSDKPDRLEDAVARLKGLHELAIDMLATVPPDRAGEFADRLSQLMPPWALPNSAVAYLGSKLKLLPHIGSVIDGLNIKTAIDVFSGSTRVAQYLRQRNITVTTSDLSWATTCYAHTYVHNRDNRHLAEQIAKMNLLEPVDGWLSKNYSGDTPQDAPAGNGRCFQRKNTRKADAARDWIEAQTDLAPWEKMTLITAVITALDDVDNTLGVQQAYLKAWCDRSYKDILFRLPTNIHGPVGNHLEGDCLKLKYQPCDLAYLDAPYSAHSYATYYHLWDSIARWDKPSTSLKSKRRVDRVANHAAYDHSMQSPWNSGATALSAFDTLIKRLPVHYVLISHSDESLVTQADLEEVCRRHGSINVQEITYSRNIMSQIGNATLNGRIVEKNQTKRELLILVDKGMLTAKKMPKPIVALRPRARNLDAHQAAPDPTNL